MSNLIVGAVDKYEFPQINNWLKSIVASGYTDDVMLIVYRISDAAIAACKTVMPTLQIYMVDYDVNGQSLAYEAQGKDTQVHQYRFFHLYDILRRINVKYDYICVTDVKDCIFQCNPFPFIHDKLTDLNKDFIAPSEMMIYRDEPWGKNNMIQGFGQYVASIFEKNLITNIGTIAGRWQSIQDMALILYLMGQHRSLPNDQSGWNILVHTLLKDRTFFAGDDSAWAAQMGTTHDPEKVHYTPMLTDKKPTINYETGLVYNSDNNLYVLVHQYDRVPQLNTIIKERYK